MTIMRASIAAMLLFNVTLIFYGIYRLNRPSTRAVPLPLMLLARLLTRIDTNDLWQPPEAAVLQQRRQKLSAFSCLGAGLCGLVLASTCIALGNAALLPQYPWSSADTLMLVRLEVVVLLGMAGEVTGASIGARIGRIVGMARMHHIALALSHPDGGQPCYADLISPLLRALLWIIPLANVVFVGALCIVIQQQPDMGLSRAVAMLWPLAIPPLLLLLSALATELVGRQRDIPAETLPSETLSEWQREVIAQLNTSLRTSDLREVYDPGLSHLPLFFQLLLNSSIAIPLAHSAVSQTAVTVLTLTPFVLLAVSHLMAKRFLPDTTLASLQTLQSAILQRFP